MYAKSFAVGMGVGLAAGAVLGAAMMPHKKHAAKCSGSKMARSIGDIIDNIAGIIG